MVQTKNMRKRILLLLWLTTDSNQGFLLSGTGFSSVDDPSGRTSMLYNHRQDLVKHKTALLHCRLSDQYQE
jgi:hypothetical protein